MLDGFQKQLARIDTDSEGLKRIQELKRIVSFDGISYGNGYCSCGLREKLVAMEKPV